MMLACIVWVGWNKVLYKEELGNKDDEIDCSISLFTCVIIILVNLLFLYVAKYKFDMC